MPKKRSLFDVAKKAKYFEDVDSNAFLRSSLLGSQGPPRRDDERSVTIMTQPIQIEDRNRTTSELSDVADLSTSLIEDYVQGDGDLNGAPDARSQGAVGASGSRNAGDRGRRSHSEGKRSKGKHDPFQKSAHGRFLGSSKKSHLKETRFRDKTPLAPAKVMDSYPEGLERVPGDSVDNIDTVSSQGSEIMSIGALPKGYGTIPPTTPSRRWGVQGDDDATIAGWDLQFKPSRRNLIGIVICYIITATINDLAAIRTSHEFGHLYRLFRVLWTYLSYFVLALLITLTKSIVTDDITEELLKFPKKYFILLGVLDALAEFLFYAGSLGTPTTGQQLIIQLTLPLLAIILIWTHRSWTYTRGQLLGIVVVCGGGGLTLVAGLKKDLKLHDAWTIAGPIIFSLGTIPFIFSLAIKDRILCVKRDFDVFYIAVWISAARVVTGWVLAPLHLVKPAFGNISTFADMWTIIGDGVRCFLGDESVTIVNQHGLLTGHCSQVQTWLTLFLCGSEFLTGILTLTILKRSSAITLALASASRLPIVRLLMAVRPIMGPQTEAFSVYAVGALPLIFAGICMYSWSAQEFKPDYHDKFIPFEPHKVKKTKKRPKRMAFIPDVIHADSDTSTIPSTDIQTPREDSIFV